MPDTPAFCTNCGQPGQEGLLFCTNCGTRRAAPTGFSLAAANTAPGQWAYPTEGPRRGRGRLALVLLLILLPLVVGGTFAYTQLTGDEPTTTTTTTDDPTAAVESTPPAEKTTATPSPASEPTTPAPTPTENEAPEAPPLAIAAEYLNLNRHGFDAAPV